MEQERKALKMGLYIIACAVVLRLVGAISPQFWLENPRVARFLVFLQTGRLVSWVSAASPPETEATQGSTGPEERLPAVLTGADREQLALYDACKYSVDLEELLYRPLSWELAGEKPTVLIVHTHATESFTRQPGEDYRESSAYRTLDTQYNMVRVGDRLAELLEEKGIRVIHDRTLHDYPSYTGSYAASRKTVTKYLQEEDALCLVLDLHRDASEGSDGTQYRTAARVAGKDSAQLMMVVGTDAGGLHHPAWEENMALAAKLHVVLQRRFPGLCRPICFRDQRFNQDLSPGAVLVEVGAAGNTLPEALVAVEALAEGIAELAAGTVTEDSKD